MDVFEIIMSIACLSSAVGITYVMFSLKKYVENLISEQKAELKAELEAWLNSEKGQKALYTIGALVAQGAKDSMPFISKGGKFKMTDLIAQIAGGAAKKFLGIDFTGQGGEPTQTQSLKGEKSIPEA